MRRVALALMLAAGVAVSGLGPAGAVSSRATAHGPLVAVGYEFACGLATNGLVKCWGSNRDGALGAGAPAQSSVPVAVKGISNAIAISAAEATCALLATGVVKCWGSNQYGVRGDGTTTATGTPTAVTGITTAVAISVSDHACALLKDGTVECWGDNSKGELGSGTTSAYSSIPVAVPGLTNVVAISTGSQLSCAVLADGTARCWGRDSNGALGTGGPPLGKSAVPLPVKGITGAVKLTTGGLSTCALLSNGNVKCWGLNLSGELGNGTRNYGRLPGPILVKKVAHAVSIAMGEDGCAALADGTAKCWGGNYFGTLGTGRPTDGPHTAAVVPRLTHVVSVAMNVESACAVLANGSVHCWGTNNYGQLGDGTISATPSKPVLVKGLSLGTHA
jgi:alpha-tubulin suppressor-like RCC1 family protein